MYETGKNREATIKVSGGVQWDGKQMTVGDQEGAVIYRTSGDAITGSTRLIGSSDVVQYFIKGRAVVAPDAGNKNVEFFTYPGGGSPTKTIPGFTTPIGSAISE